MNATLLQPVWEFSIYVYVDSENRFLVSCPSDLREHTIRWLAIPCLCMLDDVCWIPALVGCGYTDT
jgi:hypothetical protein